MEAKRSNRYVFIFLADNNSEQSLLMERNEFSHQKLIKRLKKHFVCIILDKQLDEEGKNLVGLLKLSETGSTILILNGVKDKLNSLNGYHSASDVWSFAKKIK